MARRRIPFLAALLAAGTGGAPARCEEPGPAASPGDPVVVDSFDAEALRPEWKADGAKIARVSEGEGGALEISEGVAVPPLRPAIFAPLPVRDLRRFDALAFRIRGLPAPLDLSVYLRKGETLRALEEPFVVKGDGWQDVVLPLRHMADGADGLLVDPADLDRIEFRWRSPAGAFRLDDVRLLPGTRGDESWRISDEEFLELAFGKGKGRIHRGKRFTHLSNQPEWTDAESSRFLRELEPAVAYLETRYGLKGGCDGPIRILRLRDQAEDMQAQRLFNDLFRGTRRGLGGRDIGIGDRGLRYIGPPAKDEKREKLDAPWGGHQEDYASRFLRQQSGWLGNAIYWDVLRVASKERYADMRKMTFAPVFSSHFQEFLRGRASPVLPWKELLSVERQEFRETEQHITIVEFLLASHRPRLGKIWAAVQAMGGGPGEEEMDVIARVLETTPAKLEQDWAKWGAANWK